MKIEKLGTKTADYSEVVQGGQGKMSDELVRDSLIFGFVAIVGIGSFLIAMVLQLIK